MGPSYASSLVERATQYPIIITLPLGRKADRPSARTRRIQGFTDGAILTLIWDKGRGIAHHRRLTPNTGVDVFLIPPYHPWVRGTNENKNRLTHRYLSKGTLITSHQPYLDAIAYELNDCPRDALGYCTPTEASNELIAAIH